MIVMDDSRFVRQPWISAATLVCQRRLITNQRDLIRDQSRLGLVYTYRPEDRLLSNLQLVKS